MSDETYNAALSAFESDLPEGDVSNLPAEPSEQATPSEPVQPVTPQEPEPLVSSEIDLSQLSEEQQLWLRAREREMQAQMTRRTQEAAESRREAEQAMQFLTQLNSDPDFAFQVLNHLQNNLATAGYQVAPDEYEVDEYGQYQEPDPYAQELAELKNWRNQMESQWEEANLSAHLDRQLSTIQSQHPDWGEEDLQGIIDLGFATNGDLMQAAVQYQALQDQALQRYLDRKGSVNTPAGIRPGAPATQAQPPITDEKQLSAAAKEYVLKQLS